MIVPHHSENLFEIRVFAGIRFYTFVSSFLNQSVWDILAGMKYASTAVIGLFFVFGTAEYPVYKGDHGIPVYGCPAAIVSPIM